MYIRKRVIQIKRHHHSSRRFYGLSVKNVFQFLSSLILPLMLGIFTVIITLEQQEIARQQRLEDENESRLRREQEWNIAQIAQATQNQVIKNKYQDEILMAYIKEIGDLLKENNGSLTSNSLTATLARITTLGTIRQLDGSRQSQIIRLLYEAKQLTNTDEFTALDISTAELTDIDFSKLYWILYTGQICLAGVFLKNCTFDHLEVINSDFSYAELKNVNFSFATFENVKFSFARLFNVNFSYAYLKNVNFSSASLYYVNFSSTKLSNVNFSSAQIYNVNFSSTRLENANFSLARLLDANFSSALLSNTNFSLATLDSVNFTSAQISVVKFSSARLYDIGFSSAWLYKVNFSFAYFGIEFGLSNFHRASMAQTIFVKCDCRWIDFSEVHLKGSSFHSAMLSETKFSLANLRNVDFTNTSITNSQLHSVLSIRNAKIPNGTLGHTQNLVKNGDINCNISLLDHWQVKNGRIVVTFSKEDRNKCHFSLQSLTTGAIMSQQIDLTHVWNYTIWDKSNIS